MGSKNRGISREIIEVVHDDSDEQVQHLEIITWVDVRVLNQLRGNAVLYYLLTRNEQKKIKDTKYAYAKLDPQLRGGLFEFSSQAESFTQDNIILGQPSPVAHLQL